MVNYPMVKVSPPLLHTPFPSDKSDGPYQCFLFFSNMQSVTRKIHKELGMPGHYRIQDMDKMPAIIICSTEILPKAREFHESRVKIT